MVCAESVLHSFADEPLDAGEVTVLHAATMMARNGGDPEAWLERFAREHSTAPSSSTTGGAQHSRRLHSGAGLKSPI